MGKRKAKTGTLTKIDPRILKIKPLAVSQHSTGRGARVTTTVNPVKPPELATPPQGLIFGADPSNFTEDYLGDDGNDEDDDNDDNISSRYHTTRVCVLLFLSARRLIP